MFALQAIVVVVLASLLGIGSAWLAVEREVGFEVVRAGSWSAWTRPGADDGDPYIRARMARAGKLPLSQTEGITFTARQDDAGRPLTSRCDYVVAGRMPAAQWWTLTPYGDETLRLVANPAGRYGFDSQEVQRAPDGSVTIAVSAVAQPGNWLPLDRGTGAFRLVLRLYDAPLATGGSTASLEAPSIERTGCR